MGWNSNQAKYWYERQSAAFSWFVDRQLPNNFDWVKKLSEQELDQVTTELAPRPQINASIPLLKHQKAIFLLCIKQEGLVILSGLGSGKTAIMLNVIAYRKLCGQITKALVLCPDVGVGYGWVDECKKHTPQLKTVAVFGSRQERLDIFNQTDADIYVINYIGLQAILSDPTYRNRVIQPETVANFAKCFQLVVYDESSFVKNTKSITFKICDLLSRRIPLRYAMSGTPHGRSPLDLWSQFYVVDRGLTLGKQLHVFRAAFFDAKITQFGVQWKLRKKLEPKLSQVIKNRSIRYSVEECGKTSHPLYTTIRVPLLSEAHQYYRKMVDNVIQEMRDFSETRDVVKIRNHFVKLRELCSGFIQFSPEDEPDKKERITFPSEKDKQLDQLIDLLPDSSKMIIFYEFTATGIKISKRLDALKIGYQWLWQGTSDKVRAIEEFRNNTKIRVLVMNTRSGAFGLNLQIANLGIFYELPLSPIVRSQAEARIDRMGQTKQVLFYDLITIGSVEEKILGFLKEGKDLFQSIIDGKTSILDAVLPVNNR